jgi:hypothetical protein
MPGENCKKKRLEKRKSIKSCWETMHFLPKNPKESLGKNGNFLERKEWIVRNNARTSPLPV